MQGRQRIHESPYGQYCHQTLKKGAAILNVAHFVGIGVGEYDNDHPRLERAVPDVEAFACLLGDGFTSNLMVNPTEQQVRDGLRALRGSMPDGGSLTVLWSGHAFSSPDGLRLLARDSGSYRSDGLGTSSDLAVPCAEAGANQLLLVIDTCFSGEAVAAGEVAARILRETASVERQVWVGVLASCLPVETARDGLFGHRLVGLLKSGPETPELRVRWSPHAMFIRGDDLCDALIKEWNSAAQTPDYLSRGSAVGMFPNPLYDPGAPELVVEHLLQAARGDAAQDDRSWFTGRTVEVDQVVAWVKSGEAGLRVVTGTAGTGKTAIVGRVVSLANPTERERLLAEGIPLGHSDPGERSVDAHVHARGLTADRAADLLAGQLVRAGVLTPQTAHRNAAELVGQVQHVVQDGAEPPVVVIDGLDEARSEAFAIAEELVLRLARYAVVIVSTRELRRSQTDPSLLDLLTVGAAVLDLNAPASAERGRADMRAYATARLAAVDTRMNPDAVADHLAEQTAVAGNGQFLLARLVTDQLRATPVDTALPGWQEKVSHSIGNAFDTDLAVACTPATSEQERTNLSAESARVLLSALTVAFGAGLPEDEWLACTNALAPDNGAFGRDDVTWVLDKLGRYIVQDGEAGQAVYRIAHQSIADYIHPPFAASYSQPFDPAAGSVTAALLSRYRILLATGMPTTGPWYLWRYAWRHAAASGPAGLELLRVLAATEPRLRRDVAMATEEVAAKLQRCGRRSESVSLIEEAVGVYRELAAADPTFRTNLAGALNNLSAFGGEANLGQKALSAAEEAIALYRDLAEGNPSVTPGLAAALINLSTHFRGTARWRQAVALAEEAVRLLRPEPGDDPVSVRSLAEALTNLSIHYSDAGNWREALSLAGEAVTLYRELSEENPSFTSGLAAALISLSGRYGESGRPVDAVAIAEEATVLYRGLAGHNPAFLPHLASSLDHLGNQLSRAGNAHDAIDTAEEAVGLYRDLADSDSHYLDNLGGALTHLGNHYSNAGQWEKVLGPSEEAVALYRQVSEGDDAFRDGLATALTNLASHYSEIGRPQDALAPAEQALELRRWAAEENPALAPVLAGALTNLGIFYSEVGRMQDALAPAREAVSLYRDLADNPAYIPGLASALDNLSNRYGEVRDPVTAIGLVKEAISLYRDAAQANPAVLSDLAMALGNLGNRYSQAGQPGEAVKVTEESAALYRNLAEANPANLPELARTLNNLSYHYSKVGRVQDAVGPAEESVGLYRSIAERELGFLRDVAMTLSNLGIRYSAIGRDQDAVTRSEEAVTLYRSLGKSLPDFPDDLASALVHLDAHCRKAGVPERARAAWEEAIGGVSSPAAVWLLVARADNVSAGPLETAAWLTQASALTDGDRTLIRLVHQAARRQRTADPDGFDRNWALHAKAPVPDWLTVDPALGQTAADWISAGTYTAERDYLAAHPELLTQEADIAVSEVLLMVSKDEANRYTGLRAAAREVGVDAAYRPLLLEALAFEFAAADPPRQQEMLADHRDDLLTDVVVGILSEMAGQDDPAAFSARRATALLDLATSADIGQVFDILRESGDFADLLQAIAVRPDPVGLLPAAVVAWTAASTPAQSATAVFYVAIATVIGGGHDAAGVLEQACGLDSGQQAAWIDELARIARPHPGVLTLIPVLTARLDPPERADISRPHSTEAADGTS